MNRLVVSQAHPDGHVAVLRIPPGGRVVVVYDETTVQDVSDWAADLALIGMARQYELTTRQTTEPVTSTDVASVRYEGDPATTPTLLYAHPVSGTAAEYDWVTTAHLVSTGVAVQITAGVAAELVSTDDTDSA